jgi:hypothetical protein
MMNFVRFKSDTRKELQKLTSSNLAFISDAPSYRVEGQFGAERVIEGISAVNFFIDSEFEQEKIDMLKNVINMFVSQIKILNKGYIDAVIKTAVLNYMNEPAVWLNYKSESLAVELGKVWGNKTVTSLSHKRAASYLKDGIAIFITNEKGCSFNEEYLKQFRLLDRRSLWVKIVDDQYELQKGLPK